VNWRLVEQKETRSIREFSVGTKAAELKQRENQLGRLTYMEQTKFF